MKQRTITIEQNKKTAHKSYSDSRKGHRLSGFFIVCLLAAFLLIIMINVPYSHDEWRWGSPARLELMKKWFEGYNGRLLGNLLALAITRSRICKTCVLWISTLLLLWLMAGICSKRSKALYMCLAVILLMAMPASLYAQSLGWPAAFVNYIPPVLTFLTYYIYISPCFHGRKLRENAGCCILLFLLGTAGQLFSEHNTVFNFAFAAFVIFYYLLRYKRLSLSGISFFAGTVIGAFMMFSNSAYRAAVVHSGTYKSISISISSCWYKVRDEICPNVFQGNVVLITFLTAALLILLILRKDNKVADKTCTVYLLLYDFMVIIRNFTGFVLFTDAKNENKFWVISSCLFFFCVLFLIRKIDRDALILWGCIPFICLPLVVASPIGPRCFFASYILMETVGLILFRNILDFVRIKESEIVLKGIVRVVVLFAVFILGFYSVVFIRIGKTEQQRREMIRQAVSQKADSVEILSLPYSEYTDLTEPFQGWEDNFRDFYHIPRDMQMVVK